MNNSGKDKGSYWNRNVSGNEYQLELTFKPTIDSGMKGEYIVDVDKEIKYVEELMKHLPIEDEGIERFI